MYKLLPILLFAIGFAITTDEIYDNSYALIIGIDKYQNVQSLNYAVKDAESIQDILVNTFDFPEDNITFLTNEDATRQNIIQAFSDITTKAEERDRVLIYFAGHGDTDDLPEGGEMGYLLPVDGNNDNLFVTSIAMDDLKRISLMSKAKHLLYLVDACYGGLLTIGSRGLDSKTTQNYIDKITKNKSRQIITAGGRGEEVIEKSEWGHSAFTLNLNRGLKDGNADMNADGYITANELGMFLSEKVTIDSDNQQTPQYGRMTSQEGEFVFVYAENTAVIQDKSADKKDELETKKLIGVDKDETLLDRARLSNWRKKYPKNMTSPDIYGIYALIMEDAKGILFATNLAPGWAAGINFLSIKSSLLNESAEELQSYNGNCISLFLTHSLIQLEAPVWIEGLFGMSYTNYSWPNKSNKINKILPVAGIHLGLHPLPSLLSPLLLGMTIIATPYPNSYNEIDGVIQFDDWDIQFSPGVEIGLAIPKFIFFPE